MTYVRTLAAAALMVTHGTLSAQGDGQGVPHPGQTDLHQARENLVPSPHPRSFTASPPSQRGENPLIHQALRYYVNPLKRLQLEIEATKQYFNYTVQRGDTLSEIAQRFGIPLEEIARTNHVANVHRIRVGETLKIRKKEIPYVVRHGDTLQKIAQKHGLDPDEIVAHNRELSRHNYTIFPGQTLLLPTRPISVVHAEREKQPVQTVSLASRKRGDTPSHRPVSGARGKVSPQGEGFQWPVQGRLTSSFGLRKGKMHNGVDIQAPLSQAPVKAARSGIVQKAGQMRGYGKIVILSHGDGWETYYAHLSRIAVRSGQRVAAGQLVGYQGSTGNATGEHLHFEVRRNGRPLNPLDYLP